MTVHIEEHTGDRERLRPLFELAEDSPAALGAYLGAGRVLVAVARGRVLGHLQLTESGAPGEAEIKNMAVLPSHRRRGIGGMLLAAAIARSRAASCSTLLVATAAADVDNLRFYQRAGFRLRSVERDAFTPAAGYPPGTLVGGIELRDRVWLDLALRPPRS
jgi:GNAT superfamily N-acetyltransferase